MLFLLLFFYYTLFSSTYPALLVVLAVCHCLPQLFSKTSSIPRQVAWVSFSSIPPSMEMASTIHHEQSKSASPPSPVRIYPTPYTRPLLTTDMISTISICYHLKSVRKPGSTYCNAHVSLRSVFVIYQSNGTKHKYRILWEQIDTGCSMSFCASAMRQGWWLWSSTAFVFHARHSLGSFTSIPNTTSLILNVTLAMVAGCMPVKW